MWVSMGVRKQEFERLKQSLRQSFQRVKEDITSNSSQIQHANAKVDHLNINLEQINSQIKQTESYFSAINEQLASISNEFALNLKNDSNSNQIVHNSMSELKTSIDSIKSLLDSIKEREANNLQEINSIKLGIQNIVIGLYQKLDNMESSIRDIAKASSNANLISSIEDSDNKISKKIELLDKNMQNLIIKEDIKLLIKETVQESLKSKDKKVEVKKESNKLQLQMLKKLGKNKKAIIKQKIIDIISARNLSLPELKEIIVDDNSYCSKATFYRYIEELRKNGRLEVIEVNNIKTITVNGSKD